MYADKYNLTEEQNIFLAKKLMVESIYYSAKLEGVNATFPELQTILDGVILPHLDKYDIEVIFALHNAWKYLLSHIDDTLDYKFINNLYRQFDIAVNVSPYGKYSLAKTNSTPPRCSQYDVNVDLIRLNIINPPTERAIQGFMYLMNKEVFWDRNLPVAILCANAIMIKNGTGLFIIPEEWHEKFQIVLKDFNDTGNKDQFSKFLYTNCIAGIEF